MKHIIMQTFGYQDVFSSYRIFSLTFKIVTECWPKQWLAYKYGQEEN